jgi:steroid delta-isomerase-like uncharacterized protein
MAADHASIVRAVYDAFNRRDYDALASCAAPDAIATSMPFDARGRFRDDFEAWGNAFEDGRIEIVNVVAQEDHVVAEVVGRGTHTATLSGPGGAIPATGRRVELKLAEVFRFRGGKIVEFRSYFDAFSLFQQLGIGTQSGAGERPTPPGH